MAYNKVYFANKLQYRHVNGLNKRMKADISVKQNDTVSGVGVTLYADYHFVSASNTFQFGDILKPLPQLQMPLPDVRKTKPYVLHDNIVTARLFISDMNDADPATSPDMLVINGGLARNHEAPYGDTFFETYYHNTKMFASWQPKHKVLVRNSYDALYYLNNDSALNSGNIRIRWTKIYEDTLVHAPITPQIVTSDETFVANSWVVVPISAKVFGISDWTKIYVELLDPDGGVLATQYFYQRPERTDYNVQLWFRNSFGVWDSMILQGQPEGATETAGFTYQTDRYLAERVVNGQSVLRLNTGQMDAAWLKHLGQLLYSSEVYMNTVNGFVRLTKNFNNLRTIGNAVDNNQTLEFRIAAMDEYYSNL